MKRISLLFFLTMLVLAAAERGSLARNNKLFSFQHENVLGTSLELKFMAASLPEAEKAEAAALAEIDRQAKILSAYDLSSEFSRWMRNGGQPMRVSSDLFTVLSLFDQWRARSGGALDAAAETIGRVWKNAAAQGHLPARTDIARAVAAAQQQHWTLDAATQTVTRLSDAPLALNSFAKSYIVSRATEAALRAAGVSAAVVNIGGDLVARGAMTETVGIADPQSGAENADPLARLLIRDRAVATSGNYRRGVEINGRWYSHIVDPRTGQPVDHVISATVVAPQATDAGALATAFNVMTPAESLWLAATIPGVECLLVTRDGKQLASPGWAALTAPVKNAPRSVTPAAQAWDPAYELAINFELARIGDQRYRRPYVAVWIEDKDKFPVRTLALWVQKLRWLPDLKAWSRGDRLRNMAEGSDLTASLSGATRSPGKYTLKWDGKDGHGKPVKPGRYTVYIEAAREHGTYQIMRQDMDFNGAARQFTLPGNTEIAGATLDYHKR
ncbi:MAG: DUF2271 domain-containing protein [Blastocatellia bacterium]